jgi:hypothetical protein
MSRPELFRSSKSSPNKSFRGYYSRLYEHDFYARKKYLSEMKQKNEEVKQQHEEYARQAMLEE